MRPTALTLLIIAAVLSLGARHGHAGMPLAVNIPGLRLVGPGQVGGELVITGWQPELQPTIEATVRIGGRVIRSPLTPVVATRLPGSIDLRAGKFRLGGVSLGGDFAPVPPLEENTPISAEFTVHQGDANATARRTGVLLLPTVIVPGYLNDLTGTPDPAVVAALAQRGYHIEGASPDLFWFQYGSRALDLREAARALAAYVRDVVLPKTYAARINVVGYSLGGLMVRWNMAFESGWDSLVNRFMMVGTPNEGSVMSYVGQRYPAAAAWAQTPVAHDMLPTFPFWRPDPGAPWTIPAEAANVALAMLNSLALPDGVRVYDFYGTQPAGAAGGGTWAGVTGPLPGGTFSYGAGDGIVLAESARGLPIHGGAGVAAFDDRIVMVDLGPVGHVALLRAAIARIAGVLTDRIALGEAGAPGRAEPARAADRARTRGGWHSGAAGGLLWMR